MKDPAARIRRWEFLLVLEQLGLIRSETFDHLINVVMAKY